MRVELDQNPGFIDSPVCQKAGIIAQSDPNLPDHIPYES
jgi:hypothetical protein